MTLICPRCRGALTVCNTAARCRACRTEYPCTEGGLSIRFLVESGQSLKDLQKEIYEGERHAGIDLKYLKTNDYEKYFMDTMNNIDRCGFAAMTMRDIMNRRQFDRVGFRPGMEVLDIGSGSGYLLNTLARLYGIRGTGVDISSLAIRRCLELNPHRLRFHLADAEHLPFPDGAFDRVISFDVLEHLPNQKAAVTEAARVLKPGGRMLWYAVSANDEYTWHWTQRRVSGGHIGHDEGGGHRRELFLHPEAVGGWLADLGLVRIRIVPFHSFFTLLIDERLPRLAQLAGRLPGGIRILFHLALWADLPLRAAGSGNGFYLQAEKGY